MALTAQQVIQYQTWLSDAEKAYHALVTGTSPVVVVDQNGERIEYNKANLSRLGTWISELKRILGMSSPVAGRPMRVFL